MSENAIPASARFPCFRVTKGPAQEVAAGMAEATLGDLPPGDVLIEVAWSSLNYKDALASGGHAGVVRSFPHVPGIDAAGAVVESRAPHLAPGQQVLVTGYGLGAEQWGGYARYIRVPAGWVVPLPAGLTARQSMIYGTAGFTAAQSLDALLHHGVTPDRGEVVVTGATGGVGSLAVGLLAKAGFTVAAVTGKPEAAEQLRALGAARIVARADVVDSSPKPLLAARWAGAVDTVGGPTLATILRQMQTGGCAAACGLVGGTDLALTVYPFILRGVTLVGIDSAHCPLDKRTALWQRLAGPWKLEGLQAIVREVPLAEIAGPIDEILHGRIVGRVLVRVGEARSG
jgi:putative YhdH/YhfP family quinone oxidoreductase